MIAGKAQKFAEKLISLRGLHTKIDFLVGNAETRTARATQCMKKVNEKGDEELTNVVLYDLIYMESLSATPHAVEFVWAHEIAHLLNDMAPGRRVSPRDQECMEFDQQRPRQTAMKQLIFAALISVSTFAA